ncbi:protein-L-isoaspartate O-methyltransferase [Rhodothalassium salexigens]|uniref:protein-L-isoaspartate O-methyltransferase family protein n=1 Tax=Rhodothalassium salexigens TaxID=1086 RepID=UPI001912E233|nr:protein-L-isoaspartate O-methyltransferase [Rhodothalassium salexigens]MBK5911271.1 protein-L-isoaspartate O-methyltransferase [Rhodothalassium salexigens]
MTASDAHRLAMIAGQLKVNRVNDDRTLEAIKAVPREKFVPAAYRGVAYVDEDLPIATDRYLMEPMVFARLVLEAGIGDGDTVLDVGCGTGYSTAVLARLAESVLAVESDPDLAKSAESKLAALGVDNAAVLQAPLPHGAPDQAPFDVIFLNGAVEVDPDGLIAQLADGGRLVCVRKHKGTSRAHIVRKTDRVWGGRDLFDAYTPVLPGFEAAPAFEF